MDARISVELLEMGAKVLFSTLEASKLPPQVHRDGCCPSLVDVLQRFPHTLCSLLTFDVVEVEGGVRDR
jgi:hypothetical protein